MIPDEGLIGTFGGQLVLAGGWVVFFGLWSLVACVVSAVLRRDPWTTQIDRFSGVKYYGVSRVAWIGLLVSWVPPLIFVVVRTVVEVYRRMDAALPYWWVFAGVAGVSVVCWLVVRKVRRMQDRAYESPAVVPAPEPAQQPVMGWSLDPDAPPQWTPDDGHG